MGLTAFGRDTNPNMDLDSTVKAAKGDLLHRLVAEARTQMPSSAQKMSASVWMMYGVLSSILIESLSLTDSHLDITHVWGL